MKTLMHVEHGRIDVDFDAEGSCELLVVSPEGHRVHVGVYDDRACAIDDVERQAQYKRVMSGGSVASYWLVRSAAPGEREIAVFASDHHDAPVLGYASTRLGASVYAGSSGVAYRAPGFGPRGEEGWVVL